MPNNPESNLSVFRGSDEMDISRTPSPAATSQGARMLWLLRGIKEYAGEVKTDDRGVFLDYKDIDSVKVQSSAGLSNEISQKLTVRLNDEIKQWISKETFATDLVSHSTLPQSFLSVDALHLTVVPRYLFVSQDGTIGLDINVSPYWGRLGEGRNWTLHQKDHHRYVVAIPLAEDRNRSEAQFSAKYVDKVWGSEPNRFGRIRLEELKKARLKEEKKDDNWGLKLAADEMEDAVKDDELLSQLTPLQISEQELHPVCWVGAGQGTGPTELTEFEVEDMTEYFKTWTVDQ